VLAEEIDVSVFCNTMLTFDNVAEPEFEISKVTSLFVIEVITGVRDLRFRMLSPGKVKVN
jgi:hypothetical protein